MNLLNLIEDTTAGYDNLRALMQASQSGQDAVLNIGGETITLDPMETRWIFAKYKAFNKAGRQEEFLNHLADPVKFDQHMKQLRQLIDKQKNFQGSVPGQRGVTGDTMPGQMEEDQAVEEIAMTNPERPTQETAGKINWERMIKDYMENKPYSEFEFSGDRPLTLYRSQVYAILKDFGRMKPPQKVKLILTVFGDKTAMVDYIDKLRAKGMMPKKVPAYVAPGTEPVPPGQMSLPGMDAPKIREAEAQKKNSEITELDRKAIVNPRVARAFQLARARQSAAGSDIEAFVQDELEKSQAAQSEIDQLRKDNDSQDQQMQQLASVVQQQDQEIQQLKQQPEPVVSKAAPEVPAKPAVKPEEPKADEPEEPKTAKTPTEPEVATQPQQQPTDVAEPTAAKKKSAPRKKSGATKISKPRKASKPAQEPAPDNVLAFPQGGRRGRSEPAVAQDELSAALQGVDIGEPGTGTYGLREATNELHIGDPVVIGGNVEHAGKTGDVAGFGRDKHFVIVDLYNFGKHAFHASNVQYNDYADEEDYVDEGRFKDLDIEQQWKAGQQASQDFKRREQSAGEEEPVGDFRVVRRKDGIVSDLKQHYSSNKAFAHAQALKKKYPSMEIGVRWPTGTINWTGIARENQRMDKFNIAQPTPGGSNKQREEFLNARDRLFRQMQSASPGEKEAIRLKIAELEGRAQSQGIKIRETEDLNRSGYNAIKSLSDWAEKMRTVRELQKDIALMQDPEAKAAVQQRIGDLLKIGIKQGYVKEALNDKAMSVLRSLQQPAPAAVDLNVPASAEPQMDLATVQKKIAQLDELIKMKEQIDKLFVRAQNARGGIYPGLQSDIEDEELYGVPQTDKEYQNLKDKYTKDLLALQKFIAMKKAVYREGQDTVSESTALLRLKQARQALSRQGVAEGLLYSGDTWQDVLYRINVLNDIFGDQKDLAATFEPASQPEWGPFRDQILRSRTVLDTYAKVKQLANMNVPLTDVEIEMLANVAWDGGGGPVEPAGHWGERDYDWLEDLYAQQFAVVQHLLDQKAQGHGQNKTKSGQTVHEQGVTEGYERGTKVQHPKYGVGQIVKVYPNGMIAVNFPNYLDPVNKRTGVQPNFMPGDSDYQSLKSGMAESSTDYSKRRQRERDVDAGRLVKPLPKNPQTDYARMRAKQKRDQELGEKKDSSPGKITKSEDPCWTGYHMVGKKKKNGREVPNCVPGKKG